VEFLREYLDLTLVQVKVIQTVLLIVLVVFMRVFALRLIRSRIEEDDPDVWYRIRKTTTYIVAVLTIGVLTWIWLQPLGNLATFLGLFIAGIAIALADLLKNIAGWLYVVARRPYRVDDRIEVDGMAGDVIDIRMFRTTMLEIGNWVQSDQSTGRILHVPNGTFLTKTVHNYTEGFPYVWHEMGVLVTFESDWKRAEGLIEQIMIDLTADIVERAKHEIRHAGRHYKIRYQHFTPKVWLSVKDSGVLLTGRMLVPVRRRRGLDEQAWRGILDAFAADDAVHLAYPTMRAIMSHDVGEATRPTPQLP
jgi:small-conductance mechanosensitive channel